MVYKTRTTSSNANRNKNNHNNNNNNNKNYNNNEFHPFMCNNFSFRLLPTIKNIIEDFEVVSSGMVDCGMAKNLVLRRDKWTRFSPWIICGIKRWLLIMLVSYTFFMPTKFGRCSSFAHLLFLGEVCLELFHNSDWDTLSFHKNTKNVHAELEIWPILSFWYYLTELFPSCHIVIDFIIQKKMYCGQFD